MFLLTLLCSLSLYSYQPLGSGVSLTSCAGCSHNMPPPCDLDLWPFDLESGVWVRCDVGYLCANSSLPRPLCSGLRPDVNDRHTSDRKTNRLQTASSLNDPA